MEMTRLDSYKWFYVTVIIDMKSEPKIITAKTFCHPDDTKRIKDCLNYICNYICDHPEGNCYTCYKLVNFDINPLLQRGYFGKSVLYRKSKKIYNLGVGIADSLDESENLAKLAYNKSNEQASKYIN